MQGWLPESEVTLRRTRHDGAHHKLPANSDRAADPHVSTYRFTPCGRRVMMCFVIVTTRERTRCNVSENRRRNSASRGGAATPPSKSCHSPFSRMGFADDAYQPFGWVGDTMGMGMDKVSTRTVISFARCHHEGGGQRPCFQILVLLSCQPPELRTSPPRWQRQPGLRSCANSSALPRQPAELRAARWY